MTNVFKGQYYDETNLNSELGTKLGSNRSVDWNEFLSQMEKKTPEVISTITKKVLKVHPTREAFQLFGVLTPEECSYLIDQTESIGYQKLAGYSSDYRSNTRRIIHYSDLKDILFERVKPFLKDTVEHKMLEARWKVYGLNPQFRFCRYEPGQKFGAHYDANFSVSSTDKSLYTFMIYLNGGFDGGATNFLSDSATPPRGRVLESLAPEAGMLLVFQHNIYHEGEELRTGLKYLMRSDVMYKLEPNENASDETFKRVQAAELIASAERLEGEGKLDEAVQAYKAAYKLMPEWEFSSDPTSPVLDTQP